MLRIKNSIVIFFWNFHGIMSNILLGVIFSSSYFGCGLINNAFFHFCVNKLPFLDWNQIQISILCQACFKFFMKKKIGVKLIEWFQLITCALAEYWWNNRFAFANEINDKLSSSVNIKSFILFFSLVEIDSFGRWRRENQTKKT